MSGHVLKIFVASEAGAQMLEVREAKALPGRGLVGDRYETRSGSWSKTREAVRDLSLISQEAIERANENREEPFTAEDTRRNIVVSVGVEALNALLGQDFLIGYVLVRGAELCDPCQRPSKLSGKPGFKEAFAGMGGLRVQVISEGTIQVTDKVLTEPIPFF